METVNSICTVCRKQLIWICTVCHSVCELYQQSGSSNLITINKSTASIIPHHSNYLFMYESYRCENVWKENDRGTDNNPKPDLENINGQITILNQILMISMHIASLVKRPCYLLKLSSGNENMGVSWADNSVKI